MVMLRFLAAGLIFALPAGAEVRLGVEMQTYPMLPRFYEPATRKLHGFTVGIPILPRLSAQAGLFRGNPYFDGPYNDVSNYHSTTTIFRAGAEYQIFQAGPALFLIGGSVGRMTSSWYADDHAYEDPSEPREFWKGSFSRWELEGAPRLELFREKQDVDWTLSISFPIYLGFAADLKQGDGTVERRFREDYLENTGLGVRLAVGLGLGA